MQKSVNFSGLTQTVWAHAVEKDQHMISSGASIQEALLNAKKSQAESFGFRQGPFKLKV